MEEDSSIGSENVEEQLAHATRELEVCSLRSVQYCQPTAQPAIF